MSKQGPYSVFIGNRGWTYGFPSLKAARTFVAGHEGYRYDIHKLAKLVESGKVHPPTPGSSGRPWLVRNPTRRNSRRPPGWGAIKGAERKHATKTASFVGGKRSKSRGTHKYYREGFAAADRQEQEAMRKKRKGNPPTVADMRRAKSRLMDELIAAAPTAQESLILQRSKSTMAKWSDAKWLDYHGIKTARNPATEYGVVIHGNAALSKAGFPSLETARAYLRHLMSRGVLRGRSMEILKIDNVRMTSTRVAEKAYNPTNADMVRFIKQVLANDEHSSDKELLDHFVSQGVQPAIARQWITKRDQYLRGERNPLPVGKYVTVRAKRLPNGRIELRGTR